MESEATQTATSAGLESADIITIVPYYPPLITIYNMRYCSVAKVQKLTANLFEVFTSERKAN